MDHVAEARRVTKESEEEAVTMGKKIVIVAALALAFAFAPATARADWLLTPNIGATFGGDAETGVTYGASIAWMGAGIFGAEADFAFTPDIFDVDDNFFDAFNFDLTDSKTTSVMGNVIVGVPIGGTSGAGFRPYVVGGLGWMNLRLEDNVNDLDFFDDDGTSAFAVDLGAGVAGLVANNIGVRGDIRWYRGFVDDDNINERLILGPVGDDLRNVDFWRATGGVTFRF
jgi:opacity protein-like surface antigen